MIALALLALGLQAADASASSDEITVAGARFDQTRGVLRKNVLTGKIDCVVQQTSGDPAIDTGVCTVATQCFRARSKPAEFTTCVVAGRKRVLDDYFASRQEDYVRNQ